MARGPGDRSVVAVNLNEVEWPNTVMNRTKLNCLIAMFALLLASAGTVAGEGGSVPGASADESTVVFLVRHAEKTTGAGGEPGRDPGLTEAGHRRARVLAEMLAIAGITGVHSTDYRRTRETARPFAEARGLEVETYDARDPAALVSQLRQSPGRHLVVGHSNTAPELVAMLGGEPGPPIEEKCEYDRLYVLVLVPDRPATTIQQRYGSPSCP